jgi:cytochrome c biogenesis protein CcmG/thiol:disulfide interchange protein DsbE
MRRLAVLVAVPILLAGCTATPAADDRPDPVVTPEARVEVDTAALRAQKQDAGIEDCPTGKAPLDDPTALPRVVLPCLGGGHQVNLNQLRGPLVINLWAQYCQPCRDELPYYQRLHEESPGGVRVLGIDYLDPQPAGALELAAESGVTFPLVADPSGALREKFRIRGLPGIVFVDESGEMTTERPTFKAFDSYDELLQMTEEHLDLAG